MAIKPQGEIFFQDIYEIFYEVHWDTVGGSLDVTSIIKDPRIRSGQQEGFIKNGVVFRKGLVTIHRQVLRDIDGGYMIVAEGTSHFEDFIQMNFPCEEGPIDPFIYHLDCAIVDEAEIKVVEGSRWAHPEDPDDADVVWGDLHSDGSPVESLTATGGITILEWLDVWS